MMTESTDTPKTIYIVTDGEYSDYQIVAVFDDEALAEAFRQHFGYEHGLEEFTLNPATREVREGVTVYEVHMAKDGDVRGPVKSGGYFDLPATEVSIWGYDHRSNQWTSIPYMRKHEWWNTLFVRCWAKDERHAIKIANEKRAEWLALGKWPEEEQGGPR